MMLFGGQEVLGLDVGQAMTKAVLLKYGKRSVEVEGTAVLDRRGEGIIGDEELSREIGLWLKKKGWSSRETTVNLPQYLATVQVSDFATGRKGGLDEMVAAETQHLAGLSEESFLHDYQLMTPALGRSEPVLIGICRESAILERIEQLAPADLHLADFSIAGVALAAAYVDLYPEIKTAKELHLVFDIGAENSTVAIVGEGNLLYSASLMCGTDRYNQILAEERNVSFEKVERSKDEQSLSLSLRESAGQKAAAIFESELRSALSHWQSDEKTEEAGLSLDKICLCGGGARISGLVQFLAEKFNCKGEIVGVPNGSGQSDPSLLPAYGLALQGAGVSSFNISMAPSFIRAKAQRRRRFPVLVAAVILLGVLTAAAGVADYKRVRERHDNLESTLARVKRSVAMVPEMEKMAEQVDVLEKMLLPYVEKGNNLHYLAEVLNGLTKARENVASRDNIDQYRDAWVVYLADEETFHAGKNNKGGREATGGRDSTNETRNNGGPFNPFSRGNRDLEGERENITREASLPVSDINIWHNFVAAVYTISPPGNRYEQIRRFITRLNQNDLFHNVDLMPAPETVGREDIFTPWLRIADHKRLEYRRFILRLPIVRDDIRSFRKEGE